MRMKSAAARLVLVIVVSGLVVSLTQTSAAHATVIPSAPPPAQPAGANAAEVIKRMSNPATSGFESMSKHYATLTPRAAIPAGYSCVDWECVGQFIRGLQGVHDNYTRYDVDLCCTNAAVYFAKPNSQGLNLMRTAGLWAPVYMYFTSLLFCVAAGLAMSAAASPPVGAVAERLCDAVVSFASWQFWTAVEDAEVNRGCLAIRFYPDLLGGVVPEFGYTTDRCFA